MSITTPLDGEWSVDMRGEKKCGLSIITRGRLSQSRSVIITRFGYDDAPRGGKKK